MKAGINDKETDEGRYIHRKKQGFYYFHREPLRFAEA